MDAVSFGTVFSTSRRLSTISQKLSNSTHRTPCTGITGRAVSVTWASKLFLREFSRMDKAIKDFNKAIELDPQNSIIYSNRGLVNRKLENFPQAIEDYSSEIQFGPPNNVRAFNNRAYCFAKLGQY